MAIRQLLYYPDARLRNKAQPVVEVNDDIRTLVDDMFETMYSADGCGLAATQINVPQRVLVIDVSRERNQPLCLINPEITELDGTERMQEGCLSVPGFFEEVERAEHIKCTALDRDGNSFEIDTGEILAVCIQHEIDHLDGKLFVDYLSTLKRERIKKKLKKNKQHIL